MKYARVDGQRQEALPNMTGECPYCGKPMVARCGGVRIRHWAHKGPLLCDPWWENETPWHRAWKDEFPADRQEIIHLAENGERHIADVETHDGWVIEFQHSSIKGDERRSREIYYQSLIWVVDGRARKRDEAQFLRTWANVEWRDPLSSKRRIPSPQGALFRDWAGSRAHVFFDFGERTLWWLYPESDDVRAYVQYVSRSQFVRIHREKHTHGPSEFDSLVENFSAFIAGYESPPSTPRPRRLAESPSHPNPRPLIRRGFRL